MQLYKWSDIGVVQISVIAGYLSLTMQLSIQDWGNPKASADAHEIQIDNNSD